MTECDLGGNSLGDEGTEFIATALKESTTSKLQTLKMHTNDIGPKGAAALAAYVAASASLTEVRALCVAPRVTLLSFCAVFAVESL